MTRAPHASRFIALALVASFTLPTLAVTAGCGSKNNDAGQTSTNASPADTTNVQPNAQPTKAGLTGKQKVVLLAGAALLFYLYKRYQAQDKAAAAQGGAKPQLYREDKGPNQGAIYYRKNDASHTVVWLQAPAQGVQVPADQAQQALGKGFDPNNPSAYQPPDQINPNPQQGVNGGSVESADQYAGASQ